MTFAPPVYASLTSIPSRLDRILQINLKSLLQQDYPNFQGALVTLPLNNRRGQPQPKELPTWLTQQADQVHVIRPEQDHGPIMKWLGPTHDATLPEDAWIFVCDDDQQYRTSFLSECIQVLQTLPKEQRNKTFTNTHSPNVLRFFGVPQMLWGFQGVLIPLQALKDLAQIHAREASALPDCCWRIDDDVVATWLRRSQYQARYVPSGLSKYSEETVDGLGADQWQRLNDRHACHMALNPDYSSNIAIVVVSAVVAVLVLVVLLQWWQSVKSKPQTRSTFKANYSSFNVFPSGA